MKKHTQAACDSARALGPRPKTLNVCGVPVRVVVGNEKTYPGLAGCHGEYDADAAVVRLHEDTPEALRGHYLTHEALHALLHLSGALSATQAAFGIKDDDDPRMEAWEEAIIRVLTPHIGPLFGPPGGK